MKEEKYGGNIAVHSSLNINGYISWWVMIDYREPHIYTTNFVWVVESFSHSGSITNRTLSFALNAGSTTRYGYGLSISLVQVYLSLLQVGIHYC